ncbi:hypothetical protein AB0I28_04400 [Phytomonospora sp. NPDC050363]|uniref:hypothetical protein n=1 Tax=Phytomonospora sp. NPDC050363 TaxID=3155642 RepID=UPI0033C8B011
MPSARLTFLSALVLAGAVSAFAAGPAQAAAPPPGAWGLDRVDQEEPPLDGVYAPPNGAPDVTVYVIGEGVSTAHEEFGGRASVGVSLVSGACTESSTGTAGVIGGEAYGVAKDVTLASVRVSGCAGVPARTVEGVEWVTAWGECVDLYAPGAQITAAAPGGSQATGTVASASAAAGHTAGVAAMYLQTSPGATPAQVGAALVEGAVATWSEPHPGSPDGLLNTGFLPGSPEGDFAVAIDGPAEVTIHAGESFTLPVTTSPVSGDPQRLTLMPPRPFGGGTTNVTPSELAVGESAVLTVTTPPDAFPGTREMRVSGRGTRDGIVRVATIVLTVLPVDGVCVVEGAPSALADPGVTDLAVTVDGCLRAPNGRWVLRVTDRSAGDAGSLTGWRLGL